MPMTPETIADLRRRHTPTTIPPCRVCGGKLSVEAAGGGNPTTWACSGMDGNGAYLPGRRCADRHYVDSEFVDRRHCDPDVLGLIDEVDRFRSVVVSLLDHGYLSEGQAMLLFGLDRAGTRAVAEAVRTASQDGRSSGGMR